MSDGIVEECIAGDPDMVQVESRRTAGAALVLFLRARRCFSRGCGSVFSLLPNSLPFAMLINWAYKKYKAKKQAKEEKKRVAAAGGSDQPPQDTGEQAQPRTSSEARQESQQ